MRRRTFWAALLFVVLALVAGSVAAPDAQAVSMHPKIKHKLDQLNASPDYPSVKPGRFLWQIKTEGGWWARFEWADILYRADLGQAYEVHGEIRRRWIVLGGPGTVGFPTRDERRGQSWESNRISSFTNGELHFDGGGPTHWIKGAILRHWRTSPLALREKLGTLRSSEEGPPGGSRVSSFEHGAVFYTEGRGIDVMFGRAAYISSHAAASVNVGRLLGQPRTTALPGMMQTPFSQGGAWWFTNKDDVRITHGAIHRFYVNRTRALGFPDLFGEEESRCGREQVFASGMLVWNSALGVREVSGDIFRQLVRRDLIGPVGCPVKGERRLDDGSVRQEFAAAQVTWVPSTRKLSVRYRTAMEVSATGDPDYPVSVLVRTLGGPDGAPSANGKTIIRKNGRTVWTCDHAEDGSWCHPVIPSGSYRAEYRGTTSQFPASAAFTVR